MEYKKLKDVSSIIMGQSPASNSYNEAGIGIAFFQGKADFGRINPIVRIYCSEPIRLAEPSDILMSVRAPVGDVNIADIECCIGRGLCAIRSSKLINNKFLYYYLLTQKKRLNVMATGSTFKSINKSILENIEIPIFKLDIQNKIVKVLDKAQELIAKRKEQIEYFDKIVTSQFIEMFGDPINNPMGWEVKKLKNI
ncbi:restriction endonuclease subunit S, partial [uncultured Clostridium sp.]|uniref:restriction endonuclease subunit S n=1 Tax=uncultured Clostridium sp. TaxID=59620 RepID=UPI0025EC26A0